MKLMRHGDRELLLNFDELPPMIEFVTIIVSPSQRAAIQLMDMTNERNLPICRYELTDTPVTEAFMIGEFYKYQQEWHFDATEHVRHVQLKKNDRHIKCDVGEKRTSG